MVGVWEGMERMEREEVVKEFRCGSSRVLIATDFIARGKKVCFILALHFFKNNFYLKFVLFFCPPGIDVAHISLTINYDIPTDFDYYVQRIGRSGCFGRKGVAINFLTTGRDIQLCRELEEYYCTRIDELPMHVADLL